MLKLCLKCLMVLALIGLVACAGGEPQKDEGAMAEHKVWHSLTLDFVGPKMSETSDPNPFLDYRLNVDFTHEDGTKMSVRGFYAADGKAAVTGEESGNVWQVRFSPNKTGDWDYSAELLYGAGIIINTDVETQNIDITNASGSFSIVPSDKTSPDFRAPERGRLMAKDGYFVFEQSNDIWIKGGTNSPENFLAFEGFDQTYRYRQQTRTGEAAAKDDRVHRFETHIADFNLGDTTWRGGNSEGIIGAVNYLAEKGVNSVYMLTFNLEGDGQDVWPYNSPEAFDRFDVSKLEQWNLLFEHMQRQGILVHLVLQETENELLMDGGDTGAQRQLYFQEMIARFGHLPALVWNLGEENGPVHWRPEGQNDQQRRDMANYLKAHDPYSHPVIIHTHAEAKDKDEMYSPMLGFEALDGLSLQIADRQTVFNETRLWRERSTKAGYPWVLTMDEIGLWHTGVLPDDMAGGHDNLRRHVLWGHLMAGGAGVEWYFGAHYPQNDLGLEDFRTRDELWEQTHNAVQFFEDHIPLGQLESCPDNFIDRKDAYCTAVGEGFFLIYLPETSNAMFNLPEKTYSIAWFDPLRGGDLQTSGNADIKGQDFINIGLAPTNDGRDWVLLLRTE